MSKAGQHRHLKRRAMTWPLLTLTVFCCVSGGPFGLEPLVSASGPGLALVLIVITPLVWALPDALTSCELAPAIPEEGGYIVWVGRAMGPFAGFLNAWWTWIYTLVDAAIYPVMFATALNAILKMYGIDWLEYDGARWAVAAAVVAIFAWINIRGTRLVGLTSSGFAVAIIVPFLLMFAAGAVRLLTDPRPIVQDLVPAGQTLTGSLAAGLSIVMWNYLGWDALSTIAEEVDEPAKAYPRALLIGVPLVMLVYLLPTLVGTAFVPNTERWQEGAWPMIARATAGPFIGNLVTLASLIAPVALFTASLLASSRVPLVLAEDRFLPKGLVEIHPKFGTPWKAILVCAGVFAVLVYQGFQELVELNVIMYSAALVLETSALIVLRYKEPDLPRPFRINGGLPMLALIFILPVSMVGLLVTITVMEEGWGNMWPTILAVGSGPVIYGLVKAFRRASR